LTTTTLGRLLTVRRRAAIAVAVLSIPAYLIAWDLDPWIYGILVLGLWPIQVGLAAAGILARATRRDQRDALVSWIVDVLLVAMAAGSLAFTRTISWA
jgi:hypothetical protein